jgi:hypothetical protein
VAEKEIGEQPLQLLRVVYELAENDPAGSAYMHKVSQRVGLATVQYERDRDEFTRLTQELEEAGYIQRRGGRYHFFFERRDDGMKSESQEEGYGYLSVTDEGRRKVEEDQL